nr:hypothetical protein [uncultured Clostridium sp.]
MKVISLISELGLTEGKTYDVIEESVGFYKVKLDNGNIAFREAKQFITVDN